MKEQLFENYNKITKIRSSIHSRIESDDVKEYLLLVIKCQFLESQNIQLLLNLQLQAKTISKYDKYFTNLSQNGDIPLEWYDAMDDMLEEEEDEEEYEEEKFESSQDDKTPVPMRNNISGRETDGSKIPKPGKAATKGKGMNNNPYFKKNPYLVQQSRKGRKK